MQMQQRPVNAQPTPTVIEPPTGKKAVSNSSENSFSDALDAALGLDEERGSEVTTVLPGTPQVLLNNGTPLLPVEAGAGRQDMPVTNGFLPSASPLPGVVLSATANPVPGAVGGVAQGLMASGMQKEPSTLLFLKSTGADTALSTSLAPAIPPSPFPPVNTQSVAVLKQEVITPALTLPASPLQSKISMDVLVELGKGMKDSALPLPILAVVPGENGGLPATAMVSAQPGSVSNAPALSTAPAITTPLGASGWDQELGGRVQWMMAQGVQAAALQINPPHLGPIEVRIVMDHDQANISFSAPHMLTRDALEASIPKLRDMFNDNGLSLANVNVASQSFADQRGQHPGSAAMHPLFSARETSLDEVPLGESQGRAISNLIDYYA